MIEGRLYINVSAVDYDSTRKMLTEQLARLEQMFHGEDEFVITDSEFAFGWHFFVIGVNRTLIQNLRDAMGTDYDRLGGRGTEKKFLTWLARNVPEAPRFKLAIKDEMESSKFGIF